MNKPFPHKGAIWQCHGYTKIHFWGVAITSCVFGVAGILTAGYSIIAPESQALRILLFAICCLLVNCGTLLFSIMTLLFYLGSTLMRDDENLSPEKA